nr:hypothetical protein [Tanacetum cinerariifolium]
EENQEVEFDLQPSEVRNWCFLGCNLLGRLVTHTLGCCLDKRFYWEENQEVEFDLQPSEVRNWCFLGCNLLGRLVTHTLGCCLDKRFYW